MRSTLRLIYINFIMVRYNLGEFIFALPWFAPLRFLMYFNPYYWLTRKKLTRGERLRLAIEDLGPIFVKAGQILSTRVDLIPEDILIELAKLQDRVPPFSGTIAKKMIEQALRAPISSVFAELDLNALASASIAQVHAASLYDGTPVVIKLLRPNIHQIIQKDLELLNLIARSVTRYWKEARQFKPNEIVSEIAHTLSDELDLMKEGANASQLKRNFKNSKTLYVPDIFWSYSNAKMLVMERIEGIPIHHVKALKESGMNMKQLAEKGVEVFFTQVFRDSFFHADMHPGNVFVDPHYKDDPRFLVVDFGIMGSLTTKDQRYLAENMLAFFKRDYRRVAELHVASGWVPPDVRTDQFEGAVRAVCEPIFERPLKEISFGQLLFRLFQAARRFEINIQPQLILLQKTLLSVEGVGRQLYPELDLWKIGGPFLERWLKQQVGVKAFFRRVKENLPYWSEKMPEIPGLVYDILAETHAQKVEKRIPVVPERLPSKRFIKRYFWFGLGFAFLLSGAMMLIRTTDSLSLILAALGLFSLVVAI